MHKYEFYTKISDDGIIVLPEKINHVRNHNVKIIILLLGALHVYADESKVEKEKQAILKAIKSKHETNRC